MAINFPNTPVNGSTYDYLKVRYTYTKPNAAYEGYWRVTTPGSVSIATSSEVSAGVDDVKYITPLGLVGTVEWDLLVNAVAAATANTLALRNASGQLTVGNATLSGHAVNLSQITMPSVSGSATFANSNNTINLVGVGTMGLEIGDVITVSGTSSNNKDFTVEVINGTNNITVNAAHAGGTTTKSLVNETYSATVTRLFKGKHAPIGAGQGYVDMMPSRSAGNDYTNLTNRPIFISISASIGNSTACKIQIDGIDRSRVAAATGVTAISGSASLIIYENSTYRLNTGTIIEWTEVR
jgi:hypothetical protein